MEKYYTYAYLREDGTPYYVGKGIDDRVYRKRKRGVNPPKDKSKILFLKQNLTEEEAFKHEIYMIAVFGRKDLGTGILHNRTDGGDGMSNPSLEVRKKMSISGKGKVAWNKGRKHSIETREKLSKAHKGKKLKEETKEKIRKGNIGKKHTEETKKKMSEMFIGHSVTEETRQKIRKALIGNKNASGNKNVSGTTWWTDGENNKRSVECPGDNWVSGMITYKDASIPAEIILRNKLGYNKTHIVSKERSEISKRVVKKTNSQKWMCLETGYVTTSGPLTIYQRKRGIDTSKRKQIA